MAQNNFKGKYHEGTFANGEGPVKGQSVSSEQETKGQINPATSGRHLTTQGGSGELLAGTPTEKNFDLHGKAYAGPQNLAFQPEDKGEVHNFEINK